MSTEAASGGQGPLERLRARTGRWYFHLLMMSLAVLVALVVVPAYSAILIPYLDATPAEYVRFALAFELSIGIGSVGVVATALHRHRAVVAWLAGRGEPQDVWESAVCRLPGTVVRGVGIYAVACVPPAAYVTHVLGVGLGAMALYCLALLLFVAGAGVPSYLFFEQAFRPVVREVAPLLPPAFEVPRSAPRLAAKLLVLLPVTIAFTGLLVAAASASGDTVETRLLATVGTTLACTVTVALGLTIMLRRALLVRLADLRAGLERIERGDLTVRMDPLAGDELDEVGRTFNAMVVGLRERESLHGALGSYVSTDLVDRIARDGAVVDGQEVDVTLLFADIRGFTSLAERSEAGEVVAVLNDFYELVLPIVSRHAGHANKLLGDGLLAVFGAPLPVTDHARCALTAACEMLDAVRDRYEGQLRIGVALCSGRVIAGTVGGPGKLDYTVIGDPVNVAARLESLTKEVGHPLLVAASTCERLGDTEGLVSCGVHPIRGKAQGIEVFALRNGSAPEPSGRPASGAHHGCGMAQDLE